MNAPETLRLPPHSVEAEQSLIGALLLDGSAWDRVADVIAEGDFYRDDHRRIFRHIALLAAAGKQTDIVSVTDSIQRSNEIEQTGGIGYLGEIANATPSSAAARRHAQIVAEKATLRRLITAADQFAADCFQPGKRSPDELIVAVEQRFAEEVDTAESEPGTLAEAVQDAVAYVDARGDAGGLPTGFAGIDKLTGGLDPGQLVLVAARPSVGKTAFACNIVDHLAGSGKSVLFHTMEMTRREIGMRILAARSAVPVHAMRAGTKAEADWSRMVNVMPSADGQRVWIDESPAVTVQHIRARARRMKRKHGLDLIVIDYLGLMRGQGDNRTQEIGSISRGLKALAKELGIPILCLAQLNRGVEGRTDKRPMNSDLRDSGEIEQDADVVIMLHREELYSDGADWRGFAEAIVRKNRNGPLGDVPMRYDGKLMTFSPWQEDFNPRAAKSASVPRKFRED